MASREVLSSWSQLSSVCMARMTCLSLCIAANWHFFMVPLRCTTRNMHDLPSIVLIKLRAAHAIRAWSRCIRNIPVFVNGEKYFRAKEPAMHPDPYGPKCSCITSRSMLDSVCWLNEDDEGVWNGNPSTWFPRLSGSYMISKRSHRFFCLTMAFSCYTRVEWPHVNDAHNFEPATRHGRIHQERRRRRQAPIAWR